MRRKTLRRYNKKSLKKHVGGSKFEYKLNKIVIALKDKGKNNREIRDALYSEFETELEEESNLGTLEKKSAALNRVLYTHFHGKRIPTLKKNSSTRKGRYNSYKSYPELYDSKFGKRLTKKKEYRDNRNDKIEDRCGDTQFKLTPHQQLLANYINPHTPYKSLLIFHGTGTGKTCTAITIAENFKSQVEEYGKIIIICGRSIIDNFKSNLFDKNKLSEENIEYQCTGSTYYDETDLSSAEDSVDDKYKAIQSKIKEYYDFNTYFQFSKPIMVEKRKRNIAKYEQYIRDKYSNKVIIIDEVQSVRTKKKTPEEEVEEEDKKEDKGEDKEAGKEEEGEGVSKKGKKILDALLDIAKYSVNTRMVLLSATPMFDNATEYIWLLNLMRINDNKPEVKKEDIFDEDKNLINPDLLRELSQGYVSYVRSEDPVNYPERIYPPGKITQYKTPTSDFLGYDMQGVNNFDKFGVYCLEAGEVQKEVLLDYQKTHFIGQFRKGVTLEEEEKSRQMSLIVYPDNSYGKNGLKKHFIFDPKIVAKVVGKDITTKKYKYKHPKNPFLMLGELEKYSSKFSDVIKNILNFIETDNGIIFVFCSEVVAGIIPFCLALEQNGISRYDGSELLDKKGLPNKIEKVSWKGKEKERAKYISITGKESQSKRDREIRDVKHIDNIYGKNIRVIIGSETMSEGISLKWVRQIHILDPWYNLSRIEQVIGRGIRFCSHKEYDPEDRNVTVFLHAIAPIEDKDGRKKITRDTSDIYLYKEAWRKATKIGAIEQILKESSIDCSIHKGSNVIKSDRKYSKICSYSNICNYKCYDDDQKSKKNLTDKDTYRISHSKNRIEQCISLIKQYYKNHIAATFEKLLVHCADKLNIDRNEIEEIVAHSLNDIVEGEKNIVHILNKRQKLEGKLRQKDEYYIFAEDSGERDDDPLYYRRAKLLRPEKMNVLDSSRAELPKSSRVVVQPKPTIIESIEDRDKKYNVIKNHLIDSKNEDRIDILTFIEKYFPKLSKSKRIKLAKEYLVDRLKYDELVLILPFIFVNNDKSLIEYFKYQIYDDYVVVFDKLSSPNYYKLNRDLKLLEPISSRQDLRTIEDNYRKYITENRDLPLPNAEFYGFIVYNNVSIFKRSIFDRKTGEYTSGQRYLTLDTIEILSDIEKFIPFLDEQDQSIEIKDFIDRKEEIMKDAKKTKLKNLLCKYNELLLRRISKKPEHSCFYSSQHYGILKLKLK